jgi:hypothetical protein
MTPADMEMNETDAVNGEDEAPQPSVPMASGEDLPSRF